jgi:nitric oxide reductase NorD protein
LAGDRRDQAFPRPRGGGALRRFGRRLLGPLGQVGRSLEPAVRLMEADPATARTWLRHVRAVQEALGGDLARAYGDVLFLAAERDAGVARVLAELLPDQLARVAPERRRRFLVAVDWTLHERPQAALAVAQNLAPVLGELDDDALRRFISTAAELAADSPEKAASFLRGESDQGRQAIQALEEGLPLAEVQRVLALYAAAHCGEQVTVEPAPAGAAEPGFHPLRAAARGLAWTDGHTIKLPARVDLLGGERDFLVYRVLTALCAGYLELGSFDLQLSQLEGTWPRRRSGELELQRFLRGLGNRSLAGDLFTILEDVRVQAGIRRLYPGLARDLDTLQAELPRPEPPLEQLRPVEQFVALLAYHSWDGALPAQAQERVEPQAWAAFEQLAGALAKLREPQAGVRDTAVALQAAWPAAQALLSHTGQAEGARDGGSRRSQGGGATDHGGDPGDGRVSASGDGGLSGGNRSWKDLIGRASGGMLRPERRDPAAEALDERAQAAHERAVEQGEDSSFSEQRDQLRAASRSRGRSDYAEADAWLSAKEGPAGGLVDDRPRAHAPLPPPLREEVEPAALEAQGGATYPEWDAVIGDYRPDWVLVRELPLRRASGDFVERVMAGYRPQIRSLRRQFEALRPSELELVRGLSHGDTLDLDRVIEALTVRRAGGSPSDRLYLRHERNRRDVAVAFLLDMSSSTNEVVSGGGKRIIEVEKEALVLIAEAVDAIGDRFAIWGFSGYGRDQVAFYVAKAFDQPYDAAARERIGAMSWKMENRDGAAIRHATRLLLAEPARIRLLILLSDGKPLDCGCDLYADAYAQEDTRRALVESRQAGLHPFCITVDPHSRDYLQQMYGAGSYTIIDRVEALPLRIPGIYRRLTR